MGGGRAGRGERRALLSAGSQVSTWLERMARGLIPELGLSANASGAEELLTSSDNRLDHLKAVSVSSGIELFAWVIDRVAYPGDHGNIRPLRRREREQ